MILDGTLIETDRVAGTHVNNMGKQIDTWHSVKYWIFGANVQLLSAPDGTPLWVSDAEPGSMNDIVTASTACPPFTSRPPTGCPSSRTPDTRERGSASTTPSRSRKAAPTCQGVIKFPGWLRCW